MFHIVSDGYKIKKKEKIKQDETIKYKTLLPSIKYCKFAVFQSPENIILILTLTSFIFITLFILFNL